jgi:nitric oxide reductase subunit B
MKIRINNTGSWFIIIAICSLLLGLLFGAMGGLQYVFPGFLKDHLSFQKMRPLHVYLVINWIFCGATGALYYYIPYVSGKDLFSGKLAKLHVALQLIILVIVVAGFFSGIFGGREYLEFPPFIILLVIAAWILLVINFFATIRPSFKKVPVYIWSWSTGLIFFLITITEAQLWLLPYFNNNIIRDITVQWKAMGSMVGSWNMLVYGTAMFVMEKVTGDQSINRSKKAFFFYFLGLTNLMFNWGHHTYIVPSSELIKTISYVISMTELLILANIIYSFRKTYLKINPHKHFLSFRILTYAEVWILLNLVLSITISVPAINYYTHGTHITVAHAMGATIGINTLLLLASMVLIGEEITKDGYLFTKAFNRSFIFFNAALLVFWICLVGMGLCKIAAQQQKNGFYEIMDKLLPYFKVFSISGILVVVGLVLVLIPLLKVFLSQLFPQKESVKAEK